MTDFNSGILVGALVAGGGVLLGGGTILLIALWRNR